MVLARETDETQSHGKSQFDGANPAACPEMSNDPRARVVRQFLTVLDCLMIDSP
jgi:hypothetical protein